MVCRTSLFVLLVCCAVFGVSTARPVLADVVSEHGIGVSAIVGPTSVPEPVQPSVSFHGYASPGALITLILNGSVIATTTAAVDASFTFTLTNQPVGPQTFLLTIIDAQGHPMPSITFALDLGLSTNTLISGIFLGPSITVDHAKVALGQTVTLSGTTVPNSTVVITIHSSAAVNYTVLADASGAWTKSFNSQDIGPGTHTVTAQAFLGGTMVSEVSSTLTFSINPTVPVNLNINVIGPCDGKHTADLNCDNLINLTDFSILLYFWQATAPSNIRADINSDGRVDVVDFSIFLYQWTG